jgi:LPS export ABC transporter protein LptC
MTARGNVVLQTTEGWRMSTEEMHFLNSRRKMTSDKLVRVEKEGTVLEGVGFESDPNLQHFEFQHQIRATVQPGAGALATPKPGQPKQGQK